jgi:hypothetical protein
MLVFLLAALNPSRAVLSKFAPSEVACHGSMHRHLHILLGFCCCFPGVTVMRELVVFCGAPPSFGTVLRLFLAVRWAVSGASVGSRQMQMQMLPVVCWCMSDNPKVIVVAPPSACGACTNVVQHPTPGWVCGRCGLQPGTARSPDWSALAFLGPCGRTGAPNCASIQLNPACSSTKSLFTRIW